jgi:hypothetical protein
MRGINEGPLTFTAGEALAQYRRVKLKSGSSTVPLEVEYADKNEKSVGYTETAAASGALVAIRPHNMPGNRIATAGEALAAGAAIYGGDDGKVVDTATGAAVLGLALEAATADGDQIEILIYGTEAPV